MGKAILVAAPHVDARTSPIVTTDVLLSDSIHEDESYCWFNGIAYDEGTCVTDDSGGELICIQGVWLRQDEQP